MSDWIDVTQEGDITEGTHRVVDVDGVMVAVFKLDGELFAYEDACPHDGSEVASGCIKDGVLECPHHGATFDLRSGDVLTAPAYEALVKMPLRIENGVVQVRDDRWD